MLIHNMISNSTVNGPGNRTVVWLQGCILQCENCWNPETHAFQRTALGPAGLTTERLYSAKAVMSQLYRKPSVNFTFSGGEPMHQAPELARIIRRLWLIKQDASFGLYTGYSIEELDAGEYYTLDKCGFRSQKQIRDQAARQGIWEELKERLDFAVMGRYDPSRPCNWPLRSSVNQQLVMFSSRYQASDFPAQAVEAVINEEGTLVQISGFPKEETQTCERATI